MGGILSFLALQQVQWGVEVKGIGGGRHTVAIIDVDAGRGDAHTESRISAAVSGQVGSLTRITRIMLPSLATNFQLDKS